MSSSKVILWCCCHGRAALSARSKEMMFALSRKRTFLLGPKRRKWSFNNKGKENKVRNEFASKFEMASIHVRPPLTSARNAFCHENMGWFCRMTVVNVLQMLQLWKNSCAKIYCTLCRKPHVKQHDNRKFSMKTIFGMICSAVCCWWSFL